MGEIPILEFEPILKPTVWGGRKLGDRLGKSLPNDGPFGESWEIVDLPGDQSVVSKGGLKGRTLEKLLKGFGREIMGNAGLLEGRFPLLFKFIDASKTLSVQVHPDEAACVRMGGGARPKTEAWYIIDRDPGAALYVGLKEGVDRAMFARALDTGTVEQLLNRVEVNTGDFVFLPSGTVHAIGAGVLLAEIQQSSDTTYRVFDWNRVGLDGKPRQLHVEQALESIDFGTFGLPDRRRPPSGNDGIECDDFIVELVNLDDAEEIVFSGLGPLILMGVEGDGEISVETNTGASAFGAGRTLLVPACSVSPVKLVSRGRSSALCVTTP